MKCEVQLYVGGTVFYETVIARDYKEAKEVALARNPNAKVIAVTAKFRLICSAACSTGAHSGDSGNAGTAWRIACLYPHEVHGPVVRKCNVSLNERDREGCGTYFQGHSYPLYMRLR